MSDHKLPTAVITPPTRAAVARRRTALAAACLLLATLAGVPSAAQAAPPANDDFTAAQVVTLPSQATGTTVDATLQAGEPDPTGDGEGQSVWYQLTTTTTGPVKVETCGSGFASFVDVYTGSSVGALTSVAESFGACAGGGRAYFTAAAGTVYDIAVTGYFDEAGAVALNIATPQPPANDDFADAQPLTLPQSLVASNVDATAQAGEPEPASSHVGHTVWYSLTTSIVRSVSIDTCGSTFDTKLGVYTGDAVDSLTTVATDDDSCNDANGGSLVNFSSVPGTTYRILVRGYSDDAGTFNLEATAPPVSTPPPAPTPPPPPPTPHPPAQPADVTPPTVRLSGATVQRPLVRGAVVVSIRCPAEACAANATATVAHVKLKSATRILAVGNAKTLRLALTARARRALRSALKRHRHVRVTVTVRASDHAGNIRIVRRAITLKR